MIWVEREGDVGSVVYLGRSQKELEEIADEECPTSKSSRPLTSRSALSSWLIQGQSVLVSKEVSHLHSQTHQGANAPVTPFRGCRTNLSRSWDPHAIGIPY